MVTQHEKKLGRETDPGARRSGARAGGAGANDLAMRLAATMSIDWGSAPAWLAASGGLVTLGLSVRVAAIQVVDRRREQEGLRQAQAKLVTAWVEMDRAYEDCALRLPVRNSSEQAVYNLTVALDVGVRGRYAKRRGALGPGETWNAEIRLASHPRSDSHDAPALQFTDAAGLIWFRSGIGQLRHPSHEDREQYLTDGPGAFDSIDHRNRAIEARSQERAAD